MITTALKLLDNADIDFITGKLEADRGELVRDVVGSAANKPLQLGYGGPLIGRVLAAAELATGVFAEVQVEDEGRRAIEADYDLAPALLLNYEDKALRMTFDVYVTTVALVPERSVGEINFRRSTQPA